MFIDNAELLNSTEKSRLSEFLESGLLFSEDRKDFMDANSTFLVLSCGPNGYAEFSQRMSMVIQLPDLASRPLSEKLALINYFFMIEANNAKKNIEVKREILEALLLTDFPLNVKGLEMEIKRACATACVRVMDDPNSNIEVTISDLNNEVQKSLIRLRTQSTEIFDLLGSQMLFIYDCHEESQWIRYQDTHDLYAEIRSQYTELSKRGINTETIHNIINSHVNTLFKRYNYYRSYNDEYDTEQLSKIVDPKIIHMVTKIMDACKNELQREIQPQVFYGLCLHMNSLLTLQLNQSRVDDDQIVHIVQEYPKEYGISIQLGQMFKDAFDIELPIEEIVIIAMFLIKDEEDTEGHPVLLYIFHGKGIATSLRDVTNTLTHTNNVYAYDLCLEKDSATALQEIKTLVQRIDDGQGIVVIYDMGSIKTMLDTISEETDIKIRYIYFPITLLGLDVARKCSQETDLEYLYHTTMREMKTMLQMNDSQKEIIITLCHTGEGGAFQLKQYIDQYSNLGFKTVPLAISKQRRRVRRTRRPGSVPHSRWPTGLKDTRPACRQSAAHCRCRRAPAPGGRAALRRTPKARRRCPESRPAGPCRAGRRPAPAQGTNHRRHSGRRRSGLPAAAAGGTARRSRAVRHSRLRRARCRRSGPSGPPACAFPARPAAARRQQGHRAGAGRRQGRSRWARPCGSCPAYRTGRPCRGWRSAWRAAPA